MPIPAMGMMEMTLRRRQFASLVLPMVAAACGASPNPNHYTVVSRTGPALPAGPKIVRAEGYRPGELPGSSRDRAVVEGYKLDIMANDWWASRWAPCWPAFSWPSSASASPGSSVYAESGAISMDPNAVVGVNIQRLDADKGGTLILECPSGGGVQSAAAPRGAQFHLDFQADGDTGHTWRWRRSAMRWASSPTASPPCCSRSPHGGGERAVAVTTAQLHECPGCGLFQIVPAMAANLRCNCQRCGTALRLTRAEPLNHHLALTFASLILFAVLWLGMLMKVSTAGIVHETTPDRARSSWSIAACGRWRSPLPSPPRSRR